MTYLSLLWMTSIALCYVGAARQCPSPCTCYAHGQVYCNRTGIIRVPQGIPTDTQMLDISDNNIHSIPKSAFEGLRFLSSLVVTGNKLAEGDIQDGALDLPKLVDVDLSYNGYSSIPHVLPKIIVTFRLIQNKLTTLSASNFVNYTAITYLDLSNNQISHVEDGTFDSLIKIDTLYLSFNKLHSGSLPANVFKKTAKLTNLDFRFNHLEHVVENLPASLEALEYAGNKIKVVPPYAFQTLPHLQALGFWEGQLTTFSDNAFYGLNQMRVLDCMQDQISSTLTNKTFNGLTAYWQNTAKFNGLNTLYMSINSVSTIEAGAFQYFGNLTSLWIDDNNLTTLQPEVLNPEFIPRLKELYIDSNPWHCDCHLRWLREKVDNASYAIQDVHLIKCNGPPSVAGYAWDILKPSDFVCP